MTKDDMVAWAALAQALRSIEYEYKIEQRKQTFRQKLFFLKTISSERSQAYSIDNSILVRMKAHIDFLQGWTSETSGKSAMHQGFSFFHRGLDRNDYENAPWREHFIRQLKAFENHGCRVTESWKENGLTIEVK